MKRFATLLLALLFAAGCGSGNVRLGGTVTFDDGTPLTTGAVIFSTDSFMARGTIGEDGKYDMGTYGAADGLPAGTYKVYISGATEEITVGGQLGLYSLIDPAFAEYNSTPLNVEVPVSGNKFDITVPRNTARRP